MLNALFEVTILTEPEVQDCLEGCSPKAGTQLHNHNNLDHIQPESGPGCGGDQ